MSTPLPSNKRRLSSSSDEELGPAPKRSRTVTEEDLNNQGKVTKLLYALLSRRQPEVFFSPSEFGSPEVGVNYAKWTRNEAFVQQVLSILGAIPEAAPATLFCIAFALYSHGRGEGWPECARCFDFGANMGDVWRYIQRQHPTDPPLVLLQLIQAHAQNARFCSKKIAGLIPGQMERYQRRLLQHLVAGEAPPLPEETPVLRMDYLAPTAHPLKDFLFRFDQDAILQYAEAKWGPLAVADTAKAMEEEDKV